MSSLISPKPVSYLQYTQQFNPYQGISTYSETPPISNPAHHLPHQSAPQFFQTGIHDDNKIYALVIDIMDPAARESALLELSKKREQYDDLALVLWHSFGIMPALLQEIVSVYPLLTPPNLTAHVSNRVCNALALLQCVASHSETRQLFLNGKSRPSIYPSSTESAHNSTYPALSLPIFEHHFKNSTF